MNQKLFDEFMTKGNRPSQNYPEWRTFLEFCEMYLNKHKIKNPVVVELGMWRNKQKKFYEEFLRATHISIDVTTNRGIPDIVGNTHDPKTMEMLKEKLKNRAINILFIDGGHHYKDVKKDFEMYSSLCTDIIAFHDIQCHKFSERDDMQVWRYWDKLKMLAYQGKRSYKKFLFLDIYHYRGVGNGVQMGIGVIVKQ